MSQQILDSYPDSKEARRARMIVDRVDAAAVGAAKKAKPTDDAFSRAEWDGATSNSAAYSYSSKYGVARGLASFIEILGWLVVIGSILLGFNLPPGNNMAAVSVFLAVAGMVLVGLFVIMGVQLVRATVDNADHTGEILAIMKA